MPPPKCGAGHLKDTEGQGNSPATLEEWLQTLILLPLTPQNHTQRSSCISSQQALLATTATCCGEMRCLGCSHICIMRSLEVTSYEFFQSSHILQARQRSICVNGFVYSQPSVFIPGTQPDSCPDDVTAQQQQEEHRPLLGSVPIPQDCGICVPPEGSACCRKINLMGHITCL